MAFPALTHAHKIALCLSYICLTVWPQVQLGPNVIIKSLGHLWNIFWHAGHEFEMLAMCRFTIYLSVCMMVKR
jgi:hypothetical protein